MFGHVSKSSERMPVVRAAECLKCGDSERHLVDRAVSARIEVPLQPTGGDASTSAGVPLRYEGGEVEKV
jgi:hypothetical protein